MEVIVSAQAARAGILARMTKAICTALMIALLGAIIVLYVDPWGPHEPAPEINEERLN
jgi:hypothetical protein